MCMVGSFSQYATIHQASAVKIDDDLPLDKAVLVGCGVPTGWGSAVYAAKVEPGETVVVYGIGGIGINAVQGARYAGAKHLIAVDPLENKREIAQELGATHSVASGEEAMALAIDLTRGVGADKAIVTVDVVDETVVQQAFDTIRKGGTVVITGLADPMKLTVHVSGAVMTLFRKQIKGTLFGDSNPTYDIPKILDLYRSGDVRLDELDHQDVHPRPGQRGLRRPPRRQEHPRHHRPRRRLTRPRPSGRGASQRRFWARSVPFRDSAPRCGHGRRWSTACDAAWHSAVEREVVSR